MKISAQVAALAALLIGAGCQTSHDYRAVNDFPKQESAAVSRQPTYAVKIFPSERLTPTSREGDDIPVYSSNIVGVFVNGAGTNSAAPVNSENPEFNQNQR